ncbi:MAG: transposase [Candidatus Marinimicrobia bacterium]|nr:transposase [Candidatus Neomarinimicrobiota bacterium]
MRSQRFSPEFNERAVRPIEVRRYPVTEVLQHLGVTAHILYKWVNSVKPDKCSVRRLKTFVRLVNTMTLAPHFRRLNWRAGVCAVNWTSPSIEGFTLHSTFGYTTPMNYDKRPNEVPGIC